jgi:serine/threonine-protein kinase
MTDTPNTPPGADDETFVERPDVVEETVVERNVVEPDTVEVQRVVTSAAPRALPDEVVPPHPGGPVDPLVPTYVTEDERVAVQPDGSVKRSAERVEYAPARRRNYLVPTLLIILGLALAGIAAAWYFSQSDTATVPSVTGLPLDTAVSRLQDDGFKADIVSQPNEAPQGTVYEQNPGAGTEQDEGSDVQLLVSKGPAEVTVPNTVGVSETDARDRLAAVGLKANVVEVFSDSEIGNVIAQDPTAGSKAAKGSEVRLNVSKGTAKVDVPSVVGLSQADATTQVKAAGLAVNVVPVPSDQPAGTVVAQNPAGGQADRGSSVRLNVSKGP